jgi:hypothetical protein
MEENNKEHILKFATFAEQNLDLNNLPYIEPFKSLSMIVVNCIYSLRANYRTITMPVIQRYADKFLDGDVLKGGETLSDLMNNIDNNGGYVLFAHNIFKNKQVIGGDLKSLVCYNLASKLLSIGINTLKDFKNYKDISNLEKTILSVKGVGPAAMNYLFMTAGDNSRVKADVHIYRFIDAAIGITLTSEEVQTLFSEAVEILKPKYPKLTVTLLDSAIWQKYSAE